MSPQITTLVPAYKPKYLVELMGSLRRQTVKPSRIVISDDSPDQAFVAALGTDPLRSAVADLNIEVVPGPRTGAYDNFRHLLQRYGGRTELFHLLLDDDILYPTFYERHLQAHATNPTRCVVSRRWTADEAGRPLRDLNLPEAVSKHPHRLLSLSSDVLFAHTAGRGANWLGEFSNATFHADMAVELDDPSLNGLCFTGLEDLGAFLKSSLKAPLTYINEPLGFFRTSAEQHSANPMGRPMKLAHLAYITLALAGERLGKLSRTQVSTLLSELCPLVAQRYGQEPDTREICTLMTGLGARDEAIEARFLSLWHVYSGAAARKPMPRPAPEVSVFMPVYNGARYLAATLDSLLAQDFGPWEALCIDDCSTDDSLAILQRYAALDSRIKVLSTGHNRGSVPPVLNFALPQMRGRWFVYSSQDDLFSTDWLSRMHARAAETGADAVIPDLVFFHEREPERNRSLVGLHGDRQVVLTGRQALEHSLDWSIPGNALWRAELVQGLRFEEFAANADEYSGRVFFLHCAKVAFSEGRFYYRQDNADAITKKINGKSFDRAYVHFRLYQLLREHGFATELYAREALKSLRTLQQLRAWLATARAGMSPEAVADAEERAARCEQALREHRIYDIFEPATESAA